MTKFILHGGDTRELNSDNNSFFGEMTQGFKGKVKILLCYFSRKDDDITRCFEQDKKRFLQNSKNKNLKFEIADQKILKEQLVRSDVFYMRGGETAKLLKKLSSTKNLIRLFDGKVVAGSSAGAYVLSKYYWNHGESSLNEFSRGLGIIKVNTLCHYEQERSDIVSKFLKYKKDLPLLALPNYKWAIIYK